MSDTRTERRSDPVLAEILESLEMPPAGLGEWFSQLERFCRSHGGARRYGELMALVSECQAALGGANGSSDARERGGVHAHQRPGTTRR